MRNLLCFMLFGGTLAACGGHSPRTASDADRTAGWRKLVTDADRQRLRGARAAWTAAMASARPANRAAIAAQGELFDVDRALPDAIPPAGNYRCRTFKLGAKGTGTKNYVAYPAFDCRIDREGDAASFYRNGGSQRPVGMLFNDSVARGIFLGTMMMGNETRAIAYGRDTTRDMAGVVERVDPHRWRIVLPYPAFESTLDVIELVPAG